jgi:hypothetical protein
MLGYAVIAVVVMVFVAWLVGGLIEDRTRRR